MPTSPVLSTSPIVARVRTFHIHRDGAVLAGLIALAFAVNIIGPMIIGAEYIDDVALALTLGMLWGVVVAPLHHEVAHALVARHCRIEVIGSGYSARRAYVLFRPPVMGVTVRQWISTLAAGPASNAVVGSSALVCWVVVAHAKVSGGGLLVLVIALSELLLCLTSAIPFSDSDGQKISLLLRFARSPVVL